MNDHFTSDVAIECYTLRIEKCSGLQGASMKVNNLANSGEIETINPKSWTSEQGAVVVDAAEGDPRILEWLLPARRVMMADVD